MVEPLLWIGFWPLTWKVEDHRLCVMYMSYMVLSDLFGYVADADGFISKDDSTPLVVVVPGLTSDSAAAVSC
jgi:hypothetical protein